MSDVDDKRLGELAAAGVAALDGLAYGIEHHRDECLYEFAKAAGPHVVAQLLAEKAALIAEVERLREAGNEMAEQLYLEREDTPDATWGEISAVIEAWHLAKDPSREPMR